VRKLLPHLAFVSTRRLSVRSRESSRVTGESVCYRNARRVARDRLLLSGRSCVIKANPVERWTKIFSIKINALRASKHVNPSRIRGLTRTPIGQWNIQLFAYYHKDRLGYIHVRFFAKKFIKINYGQNTSCKRNSHSGCNSIFVIFSKCTCMYTRSVGVLIIPYGQILGVTEARPDCFPII